MPEQNNSPVVCVYRNVFIKQIRLKTNSLSIGSNIVTSPFIVS